MQEDLVRALRSQSPAIRERWERLLHVEPATTPLADPDTLVYLLDWTLEEIFRELTAVPSRRRLSRRGMVADGQAAHCPCGRNPLLTFFAVGEQAMREALVLTQAASPALDSIERDASLAELDLALHHIARREIESFCGVCQHREVGTTSCTLSAVPGTPLAPASR